MIDPGLLSCRPMRTVIAATLAVIALLAPGAAAALSIIPLPVKVTPQPGHFTITSRTTIWTEATAASPRPVTDSRRELPQARRAMSCR